MSDEPLFKVGSILLLVGAILSALGAALLLLLALGLGTVIRALDAEAEGGLVVAAVYGVLAIVLAIGSVFGFLGFKEARDGNAHKAFVYGLVCALVPPVQIIPLLGAIFCKVAPNGAKPAA